MGVRKTRTDSTEAKKQALQDAQKIIEPPQKLTKSERQYWDSIIGSRALESWTPIDKQRAVILAKIYVELDDCEKELEKNKRWFISDNGLPKLHPLHNIHKDLLALEMSMCRSLQIHSRATNGESRDQVKTNQLFQQARNTINDSDDLIARVLN